MGLIETSAWNRIQQYGVQGVTPMDLLTVMVTREERDVALNEPLVRQAFIGYPLARFIDLSHAELRSIGGLDLYESGRLLAGVELGRRAGIAASSSPPRAIVTCADQAYERLKHYGGQKQEHFVVVFLDSKAQITAEKVVHIGTLNMSVVGAREVFREAVRHNAASVIVAHNHPSGDPEPSPEDVKVTQSLKKAGELLDIPLLDHLVIGHERYVSLHERGLM